MKFEVTILGSSSAIPTKDRFPTSQLLNIHDRLFLVDCGEGTQMQLRRYKFPLQRIHSIFISHLHADHILGLPGLLSTMNLLGRVKELHIYGPQKLEEFMDVHNRIVDQSFRFRIFWHHLDFSQRSFLMETDLLTVESLPLQHSMPCCGFLFYEKKRKPNIRKESIIQYGLTVEEIQDIKSGGGIKRDGLNLKSEQLIFHPPLPRKYAFITDTAYLPSILPDIEGVDLLYHESTFAEDFAERAKQTEHSTAIQAATMARDAGVEKLLIGHFSVRYKKLNVLLDEARTVFPATELAEEGKVFQVPFKKPLPVN